MVGEQVRYCFEDMKARILKSGFSLNIKILVINLLKERKEWKIPDVSKVISELFPLRSLSMPAVENISIEEWNDRLSKQSGLEKLDIDKTYHDVILQCLIREKCFKDEAPMLCCYRKR